MTDTNSNESSPFSRQMARVAVSGYTGAQEERKAMMNRIRDIVRKKYEDIPFDAVEEEKDEDDFDAKYADDQLAELVGEMRAEGTLTQEEEMYLREMLRAVFELESIENRFKTVMTVVESEPIYEQFLEHVRGIGPTIAARLIHMYGYCEDFDKTSQLWSYSGLAPGQERKAGEQLTFNPDARTLAAYLVGTSLIRQSSHYRTEFYDPYKEEQVRRMKAVEDIEHEVRQEEYPDGNHGPVTYNVETGERLFRGTPPESDGHAHARARRYMAKKFLKHYHYHARRLRGLETPSEWVVTHGGHEESTDTFENPMHALRVLTGTA